MGNRIDIHLTDETLIELIRKDPEMSDGIGTQTERDVLNWLDEINKDPESPQRHLKPAGRDLTLQELQVKIGGHACFPLVTFNTSFGRTSERNMRELMRLALAHVDTVESIDGGCRDWWEKSGIEDTLKNRQRFAPLSLKSECRFWPLLSPLGKEISVPGYVAGWPSLDKDGTEVRVVLANVNYPILVRRNTPYRDRWDNDVFRDPDGHRYLQVPLIPFGEEGERVVQMIYGSLHRLTGISEKQFSRDYLRA